MYNDKTIDYFSNPRNMGEINNLPVGSTGDILHAKGGNPACGDVVELFLIIDKNIITDIKFKAFGCGACIASSSALTEIIKGKTINNALKITNQDVANYLGGLPPQKMICSNFSTDVLKKALKNYSIK